MIKQYILTISIIFFTIGWHFDVYAQDLKFDNLVLVSGVDKQVGAVYRQTLAASGIDATITIVDLTGGTTLHTFDNNGSGNIDAFQPTISKSATLVEEYARFQFDFFVTGTSIPTNVVNAEINAVDVDGCCGLYEYSVYHGADSYTLETPTLLTAYEVPEGVRFQGPYGGPTGIDYSRTDYIAKVKYNSTESFTIDIGSNGNSIWPDREASVYFKEITFSNPATTLTTGGQIDFDGIDDYVEVPTSLINSLDEFTISFWIKPEALPGAFEYHHIIGQKDRYDINMHLDGGGNTRIWSRHTYNSGSSSQSIASNPITADNWVHFAFVVNYTTAKVYVYQNGEHVSTGGTSGGAPYVNGNPLRMGSKESSQPSVGNNFNGWLDEVRIFDINLTRDQIQRMVYQEIENKNGNVHGTILNKDIVDIDTGTTIPWSNLIAYYPMNNIIGSITDDESLNTNNGHLYNMTSLLPQTAPMPYISSTDGPWTTEGTWLHGDVWDIEDIPNNKDWSIVQISDNVTTSDSHTQLGMFIDSGKSLSVSGDNEINNTWYLELNGTIDLADDSQLVQGSISDLVTSATGKILRRQEGNASSFWYNYWSSPIGSLAATTLTDNNGPTNNTNNTPLSLNMLKDGTGSNIQFTNAFDEVGKVSTEWIHSFQNGITYFDWNQLTPSSAIQPGVGYTQKGTGNAGTEQQYLFEGKPNNGTILLTADDVSDAMEVVDGESKQNVTLTTTLIGNPYPSALDAIQFINDNKPGTGNGTISGTILLWEQWAGDSHYLSTYEGGYGFINNLTTVRAYQHADIPIAIPTLPFGIKTPTNFLPVGQGFFVEVIKDSGDIEFNNGQRVFKQEDLGESVFYRTANTNNNQSSTEETAAETQILRLEFGVSSGASRSFVLGFTEDATDGYDYGLDGGLINDPPVDDMGSLLNGEQYVIQAFAPYTSDKEIDLILHASGNFTYTLKSTEISNFPADQDLFIKDILTGQNYDLRSAEPYNFTSVAGSFTNRFQVVFQDPAALSTEDFTTDNTLIYVNQTEDKLHVKQLTNQVKELSISNMLGQRIKVFNNINSQTLESGIDISSLNAGIYIVSIKTDINISIDKKVIIN